MEFRLFILSLASLLMTMFVSSSDAAAQDGSYDVFVPISKYVSLGDSEKLSAWFADDLEISILSRSSNSSKVQARQILKSFFESNTPRSFKITHTTGKGNMKYALGSLKAGGESFLITIFVSFDGDSYKIQQLKIDRE